MFKLFLRAFAIVGLLSVLAQPAMAHFNHVGVGHGYGHGYGFYNRSFVGIAAYPTVAAYTYQLPIAIQPVVALPIPTISYSAPVAQVAVAQAAPCAQVTQVAQVAQVDPCAQAAVSLPISAYSASYLPTSTAVLATAYPYTSSYFSSFGVSNYGYGVGAFRGFGVGNHGYGVGNGFGFGGFRSFGVGAGNANVNIRAGYGPMRTGASITIRR